MAQMCLGKLVPDVGAAIFTRPEEGSVLSPEPIRPSYDNSQRRTVPKVVVMPVCYVTMVRLPLDTVWLIYSGRPQAFSGRAH
jgi:hypothetical protein